MVLYVSQKCEMPGQIVHVRQTSEEVSTFDLDVGQTSFGSSDTANVRFKGSKNIEPIHFVLEVNKFGHAIIYNKSTKWPVQINGEEVQIFKVLKHNDKFALGGKEFIYKNEKITDKVAEKLAAVLKKNIPQNQANRVLEKFKIREQSGGSKETSANKSTSLKNEDKCKTTSKIITKKALNTPKIRKRLSLNSYPESPSMRKSCISTRNMHFENIPEELISEEQNLKRSPEFKNAQNTNTRKSTSKAEFKNSTKVALGANIPQSNRSKRYTLCLSTSQVNEKKKTPKRRHSEIPSLQTNVKKSKTVFPLEKPTRKLSLPIKEAKRRSFRRYSEASKRRRIENNKIENSNSEEQHVFNEQPSKLSRSGVSDFLLFSDEEDVFSPEKKSINQSQTLKNQSTVSKSQLENYDDSLESSLQLKISSEKPNDKVNVSVKGRQSIRNSRTPKSFNLPADASKNESTASADSLDLFDSNSENEVDASSKLNDTVKSSSQALETFAESGTFSNTLPRRSAGRPRKSTSNFNQSRKSRSIAHVTAEDEINIDVEITPKLVPNENVTKNENIDIKSEKRPVGRPSKRLSSTKNKANISSDTLNKTSTLGDLNTSNFNNNSPINKSLSKSSDSLLSKVKTPQNKIHNSTRRSIALNQSNKLSESQLNTSQKSNSYQSDLQTSSDLNNKSTKKLDIPPKSSINIDANSFSHTEGDTLQSQDLSLEENDLTDKKLQSSTPYATRTKSRFTFNSQSTENEEIIEVLSTSSNSSKKESFRRTSSVVFIDVDNNATDSIKTPNKTESVIYMGTVTPNVDKNITSLQTTPENNIPCLTGFKTPANTPRLFDNLRKSVLKSRTRLSALKSASKEINVPQKTDNLSPIKSSNRISKLVNLAKNEEKTLKSPKNDSFNVSAVKDLFSTPIIKANTPKPLKRLQKSPKNDLSNVSGVRQLLRTPKMQKSPKNDLSSVSGVKRVMKLPAKSPYNDLTNISGVAELFTTPTDIDKTDKVALNNLSTISSNHETSQDNVTNISSRRHSIEYMHKTSNNDLSVQETYEDSKDINTPNKSEERKFISSQSESHENDLNISGIKELIRSPGIQRSPEKHLSTTSTGRKSRSTSKAQKEPKNDLSNLTEVKSLVKTSKVQKEPKNDLTDVSGVKRLLRTPKVQKEPKNDLTNVAGVKKLLRTPKAQKEPENDLTNVAGVKKLLRTPKVQKEPKNDLSDVGGVKMLLRTPKNQKSPNNNLKDIVSFKHMFQTPKEIKSPKNDLSNVSGINFLYQSPLQNITNQKEPSKEDDVDLFDKISNRQKLRTYAGKSPNKSLDSSFISDGEPTVTSFVKDWVAEQNSEHTPQSSDKNRKSEKENLEMSTKSQRTSKKKQVNDDINENVIIKKRALRTRKESVDMDLPVVTKSSRRGRKDVTVVEEVQQQLMTRATRRNKKLEVNDVLDISEPNTPKKNINKRIVEENVEELSLSLTRNAKKKKEDVVNTKPKRTTKKNVKAAESILIEAHEKEEKLAVSNKTEDVLEISSPRKTRRGGKKLVETENKEFEEKLKRKRGRKNAEIDQQVEVEKTETPSASNKAEQIVKIATPPKTRRGVKNLVETEKKDIDEIEEKPKRKRGRKNAEIEQQVEVKKTETPFFVSNKVAQNIEISTPPKTRRGGKKFVETEKKDSEEVEEKPKRKRGRKNAEIEQQVEVKKTETPPQRPKRQCRKC